MRRLVVNGDDFGLSPGVNEGIIEAHTNGILTSTSMMVRERAAGEAAQLARDHPALSVGLHFVEPDEIDLDDPRQAERAFTEQLERFRELIGRNPTHVDSHHHVHASGNRMEVFRRFVAPLGVPLRRDGSVAYIGGFWAQWKPGVTNLEYVSRRFLLRLVATETTEGFNELACHPARVTGDFRSSYLEPRAAELQTLTEPELKEELEATEVKLVSYHAWPAGAR